MNLLSPKVALFWPAVTTLAILLVQLFAPVSIVDGVVLSMPILFYLMGTGTMRYVNQLEARITALEKRLVEKSE